MRNKHSHIRTSPLHLRGERLVVSILFFIFSFIWIQHMNYGIQALAITHNYFPQEVELSHLQIVLEWLHIQLFWEPQQNILSCRFSFTQAWLVKCIKICIKYRDISYHTDHLTFGHLSYHHRQALHCSKCIIHCYCLPK